MNSTNLNLKFHLKLINDKRVGRLGGFRTKAILSRVAAGCLSGSCYLFGRQSFSASCCCGARFCLLEVHPKVPPTVCLSSRSQRRPAEPRLHQAARQHRVSGGVGGAEQGGGVQLRGPGKPPTHLQVSHCLTCPFYYGNKLEAPQVLMTV